MKKQWEYSKHYRDTAQGHICLSSIRDNFENKAFMIHLERHKYNWVKKQWTRGSTI